MNEGGELDNGRYQKETIARRMEESRLPKQVMNTWKTKKREIQNNMGMGIQRAIRV